MYELTTMDCADVGAGFAPLAGMGLAISMISNSGPLYDFFSGFFDGLNNCK